jgi:AAA ATPase domain
MLGDRLREARRRRFVGRAAELELFETALETSSFAVLFIHGPGGVGKTALLRTLEEAAQRSGAPATYVDLRSIAPSPREFVAAAGRARVLLLDTYESAAALDGWLRERFLPELPSEAIVVIAGRDPPAPAWREDPGWRDLLRTVSLRNLDRDDARAYLRVEGVPESQHGAAFDATHGHPLALRLLVEVLAQREGPVELGAAPDVVRELLSRFVADAPAPGIGRRSTSAPMPAPRLRACSTTRWAATMPRRCSTGCAACRSSTRVRTGRSRTTSCATRSTPTCAGATAPATSTSTGAYGATSSRGCARRVARSSSAASPT